MPTPTPQPTPTPAPLIPIDKLENWTWLESNQPARATQLLQLPWIADGVDVSEQRAAEDLIRAARWYPDTFNVLIEMPWLQDTITVDETHAIYGIRGAARLSLDFAERVLQKPWVQDDITRDEGIILRRLYWLVGSTDEGSQQRDVAISIIDMPFLDDVTFAEARAIWSLENLTRRRYQDTFRAIMSHPKVQDGIIDQEAKVLSVIRSAAHYAPETIPHLLDGLDGNRGVYLEERTIQLPMTGETLLTIVRTQDQTTTAMDYLEHSVRFAEKFMAAPFPTNYIALCFGDATGQSYGAHNWYTHMTMAQHSDGLEKDARTIPHEVGHYYFRDSGSRWVNEGAPQIITFVSENERAGYPVDAQLKNRSCDDNIKTLAASDPDEHSGCARNLGERFFLDLYLTLGHDDFLQGFRALYRMRLVDTPNDDCDDCTAINVHHVLEAFTSNVPEDVAAKAKEVLLKWYGPLP